MPKVIIIGAGISGLAIGFRLQQLAPAIDLVILEQKKRPGGTMWTERQDGFQVEIGPNGFLDTKSSTWDLCRDLGLKDQLISASETSHRNRYLFLDGKLHLLPASPLQLLKTDLLTWRGKTGLLLERFRPGKNIGLDESVRHFAQRRAGTEIADVFADALVTGIYAGDPNLLSLAATFPRLAAMEAQYGSVTKGFAASARQRRIAAGLGGENPGNSVKMWSFSQGLRVLVEKLQDRLKGRIILGAAARRLERVDSQANPSQPWLVHGEGTNRWAADAVILACPAYQQAALLVDIDRELAERIGGIAYNRVAVIALGYRRLDVPANLNGFGYIAPQRTRGPVLGVQWCSSIFPNRSSPGTALFRAMSGGWHRADIPGWSDERLVEAVRHELGVAMGITASPIFHSIIRWDRAIPQYLIGHPERVAWIEKRCSNFPGLFLGGNAYHGVAVNDCTEQGGLIACRVAKHLDVRVMR